MYTKEDGEATEPARGEMRRNFDSGQTLRNCAVLIHHPRLRSSGGASIMDDIIPTPHLYPAYRERDPILYSSRTGLVGLGAGLFAAGMKNAYFGTSTRAATFVTVYGSTIPIYGTSD